MEACAGLASFLWEGRELSQISLVEGRSLVTLHDCHV